MTTQSLNKIKSIGIHLANYVLKKLHNFDKECFLKNRSGIDKDRGVIRS